LQLQPTAIEQEAQRLSIPVLAPATLKTPEALEEFRAHNADAAVVVAYGMILPQAILDAPKHGCFNLHASRLPRWRGAAPINRAIMEGDPNSGVMVMKMDAGLDTGDIVEVKAKSVVDITSTTTALDLHNQLAQLGAVLMTRAMNSLEHGKLHLSKQTNEGLTYARKIEKAETRIDWNSPREVVLKHINGLSPFPGAWCEVSIKGDMVRLKVLRCTHVRGPKRKLLPTPGTLLDNRLAVACTDGAIRILNLQLAGGQAMQAEEFLKRTPLQPPLRLA